MKVLVIGTDKNIFKSSSPVERRVQEYAALTEELHIVVYTPRNFKIENLEKSSGGVAYKRIGENVFGYPTFSKSKHSFFKDAHIIGSAILKNELSPKKGERIQGDLKKHEGSNQKISKMFGRRKPNSADKYKEWVVSAEEPFTGLVAEKLKRDFGVLFHLQLHNLFFSKYYVAESFKGRLRARVARRVVRSADCIRAVSEEIKSFLVEKLHVPQSKIMVLPIFTDIKKIVGMYPRLNLHEKYPQFDSIILMLSRLVKQKNIPLALEVMKEVVQKYPKTGLVIVGSGTEEEKLKKLAANSIKNNVIFEPWAEDVVSYFKTADIFLSTTNYEGWGLTSVEALAAGCPVIMSRTGCADEVLKDGENGFVVEIGDKAGFVTALDHLLGDTALHKTMRIKAAESVLGFKTKNEYLEAYKASWERCR